MNGCLSAEGVKMKILDIYNLFKTLFKSVYSNTKYIKNSAMITVFFIFLTVIPIGIWKVYDFIDFELRVILWTFYYVVFVWAFVENYRKKYSLTLADIGLNKNISLKKSLLLGIGASIFTVVLAILAAKFLPLSEYKSPLSFLFEHSKGGLKGQFVIAFMIIPFVVSEEIIFRGLIYGYLKKHKSFTFALLISSFLFAAMHGSPLVMLIVFIYGVIWVYLYEKTGGIIAPIIAHYLHNIISIYL
ncbi:MAG: type II CAAX endopeptidase family protein [Elusimicrobiota bacterium]|nr:type II CAAX endopeptidase family protein [Elusimicrobiota bacterium]